MTTSTERIAICPGSFDPITLGHEDIIRRALSIADRVVVGVGAHPSQSKSSLFPVEERLEIIGEIYRSERRVEVATFDGLVVDFARAHGATFIVRGVRGVRDFEYEAQMSAMNGRLAPNVETILLAADPAHAHVSATLVREIASLGGDVSAFLSPSVFQRVLDRLGRRHV